MTTECHHCGATIKNQGARFCEFCGTEIVREGAPRMQTRDEALETRFDLLREHGELQRLMKLTPKVEAPPSNLGILIIGPVMIVFIFFFMKTAGGAGAPGFFFLIPLVALGVVGFGIAKGVSNTTKYRSAPLQRSPAIVVDERVKVSGGGKNSSARTAYFATLEFEDGQRREYSVGQRLAGSITEGDAGVAYTKHKHLAAFERLSV
jgi:Protein of unknown function (DUF2500)